MIARDENKRNKETIDFKVKRIGEKSKGQNEGAICESTMNSHKGNAANVFFRCSGKLHQQVIVAHSTTLTPYAAGRIRRVGFR